MTNVTTSAPLQTSDNRTNFVIYLENSFFFIFDICSIAFSIFPIRNFFDVFNYPLSSKKKFPLSKSIWIDFQSNSLIAYQISSELFVKLREIEECCCLTKIEIKQIKNQLVCAQHVFHLQSPMSPLLIFVMSR